MLSLNNIWLFGVVLQNATGELERCVAITKKNILICYES